MRTFKIFVLAICVSLAFLACRKTENLKTITITGFDTNKCGCCWGWEFRHQGDDYLIGEWPEDFPIQPADALAGPVSFKVEVELVADENCANKFKATWMELVE